MKLPDSFKHFTQFTRPATLSHWPFIIAIVLMIFMCLGAAVWFALHLVAVICLSLYTHLQHIWARIKHRKQLQR